MTDWPKGFDKLPPRARNYLIWAERDGEIEGKSMECIGKLDTRIALRTPNFSIVSLDAIRRWLVRLGQFDRHSWPQVRRDAAKHRKKKFTGRVATESHNPASKSVT